MLQHPISLLGLTRQKENQFADKGITTVEGVASFFPRRYHDFRTIVRAHDAVDGSYCALRGQVTKICHGSSSHTAVVAELEEYDPGLRRMFNITWFGTEYYINKLTVGSTYVFCGKVSFYSEKPQITNPIAFGSEPSEVCGILPVYSKIKGMSSEYLIKQIAAAINYLKANDRAGEKDLFAASLHLMPKYEAYQEMHHPTDRNTFLRARQRMAFEDIYDFYADLKQKDLYLIGTSIQEMTHEAQTRSLIDALPFSLTPDQLATVETIIGEAKEGRRIHSLVSGDVGCGKTMVAILASVFSWENGYQTIVMVPTLVLAGQHYKEFQTYCAALGVKVGLLTNETRRKERSEIMKSLADGTLDILIGTHAVLNDDLTAARLGLTIIDEEHKFGVRQKAKLEEYDKAGVHHLSMTATPIPRSIALSVYGSELAVLPICTMPQGRKPIITEKCFHPNMAFEKIYQQVRVGHQAYIVCPFIEDSESPQFQGVTSVTAALQMVEAFLAKKPDPVSIGVISGNMKQTDIINVVNQFAAGLIDVLLSTTIIEVGVNVPNATVIAVMSAERFGLAALHQLRGRVGRGEAQSYCLLCAGADADRLNVMCATNDGFAIAEHDMKMRGPGDLTGDAQSGDSKVIETIISHPKLAQAIRKKFFSAQNGREPSVKRSS